MISIICVYNDRETLERILLPSLRAQTVRHEIISINNTSGVFKSAASALNYGTEKANGKYFMFVHQDVELKGNDWLEQAERFMEYHREDIGIAGVAGRNRAGFLGKMSNAGESWDYPHGKADTVDECLMIVPEDSFLGFDEDTFDGWHCYGADHCLWMKELGYQNYVLPLFVYHRSKITNTRDLWEYQRRLYWKHRRHFPQVYTTSGSVSLPKALAMPILIPMFKWYYHYRKDWMGHVAAELEDCVTILDVGCGYNSPLQKLKGKELTGVDIYLPYIEESSKKGLHSKYIQADLREVDFPDKSFDAVFCSEVLEHLEWMDGINLLNKMDKWAKRKVIVTTPNGYVGQEGEENPYQEHKSGWSIENLKHFGFTKFRGMGGLKCLRSGDEAEVRWRPLYLWEAVATASQAVTDNLPSLAFQILAVKEVG